MAFHQIEFAQRRLPTSDNTRCLVAPAARQDSNFNLRAGVENTVGPIAFATAAPHQTHERPFTLASAAAAELSIVCASGDQTGSLP